VRGARRSEILRCSHAAGRGLADVRPEDTGTSIYANDAELWVVAWLDVPRLDAGDAQPQLQVGFDLSDPGLEPLVATWETHGYLLDAWRSWNLGARPHTPAGMAARAFDWLEQQLQRPAELAEWRTWRGKSTRMWRPSDTGQSICCDFASWKLQDRRPADSVTRLR
jgi:hypothetical protein